MYLYLNFTGSFYFISTQFFEISNEANEQRSNAINASVINNTEEDDIFLENRTDSIM